MGDSSDQDCRAHRSDPLDQHGLWTPGWVVHLSERDDVVDQQANLARERKDVDKRIARLVAAIETGGEAASLITKLRELESRRQAISLEDASLNPVPRLEPAVGGLLEALFLARINRMANQAPVFTAAKAARDRARKTKALKEWGLAARADRAGVWAARPRSG